MPKKKQVARKGAQTLRVPSVPSRHDADRMASLVVVQGADVDLGRQVLCDRPITIGRDDEAELSLSDGSISRRHCRVERDDATGHYVLVDLGSTNGTAVNQHRVVNTYPLSSGDKLYLGASVIRFSLADALDLAYESRLKEMVATDTLTGLGSRRAYDTAFATHAEAAALEGSLLTVLVMDMDGLKQINDAHGHEMGGYTLVEMAWLMRQVFQDHGVLCRFGGDEFVGCFPGLDRDTAVQLAETLRDRVAHHNFVRDGVQVEPTISIGVATFPGDVGDPTDLFTAADQAMYRAKRAGKNRVATPGRARRG